MAQRLAELCSLLVEDAYGDLAAQIFTNLAEYGRLPLVTIRGHLPGISLRRLKVGLTTLIQHHLVLHYSADEFEPTYFQVDWNAAYILVRQRKLLNLVEDREGEAAGQLISNILQLGHASIGDLAEEYDLASDSKRDSGIDTADQHVTEEGLINGIAKEGKGSSTLYSITTAPQLHTVLQRLLANGFLVKVNDRTSIPFADLQFRLRDTVIAESFPDGKITGSKKEKAFQREVNHLKRKWQNDDDYSESRDVGSHGEIKHSNAAQPSKKRLKSSKTCNGVVQHSNESERKDAEHRVDKLPKDMVVRVNFAKCTTLLRNQRFQQMIHRFLGPPTAAVYGALLRAIEVKAKVKSARAPARSDLDDGDDEEDETRTVSVTDSEVSKQLDESIDLGPKLTSSKSASKQPNGIHKHHSKVAKEVDDGPTADLSVKAETHYDSEDDVVMPGAAAVKAHQRRLEAISKHLDVLSEHPKAFCIRTPGISRTEVDFKATAKTLIGVELEKMISARFGKTCIRLVRILRERGKIDEQQIAEMTMARHKDTSAWLTALQFAGLAHGQEIPKDNAHNTARSLFLWWFDEESVRSLYLERTYQAMSRTLQRLRFERATRFKAVIDKVERMDVKGRESEMLNQQDKEILRRWQDVEEQLLVQLARLDDLVAVLRDFGWTDTSLTT